LPFFIPHHPIRREHQQQMQTRRRGHLYSYWIVLADVTISPSVQRYRLQYIDCSRILVEPIELAYPYFICRKLPAVMNNVLVAIDSNHISCSFCSETILDVIGKMSDALCYNEMCALFNSDEAFELYCIEMVSCRYIHEAFGAMEHDNRAILSMEHYGRMFLESKLISREKNSKRRLDERYLGKLPFHVELLRSFNEFLAVVVKIFGFKPYEFKYLS
jgi:hypothetical protein